MMTEQQFLASIFESLRNSRKEREYKTYILLDKAAGIYKIGRAVDVEKRIKNLTVANANLSLVLVIDGNVENALHKEFAGKKIKSEWFSLTTEDIESISRKYK